MNEYDDPNDPEAQRRDLVMNPPLWQYAPKGTSKTRQMAEFDALTSGAYDSLVSGSGLDRANSIESFRLRRTREQDTRAADARRIAIHDAVAADYEDAQPDDEQPPEQPTLSRAQVLARARLAAMPTQPPTESGGFVAGAKSVLNDLGRPGGAIRGLIQAGPGGAVEGFKDPSKYTGETSAVSQSLPEGSIARTVHSAVYEAATDPFNVGIAAGGPAAARLLTKGGKVGRGLAEFVKPIAEGSLAKRYAAEVGINAISMEAAKLAQQRLQEGGYGEGAQLAGGLAAGLVGGVAAISAGPQAIRGARAISAEAGARGWVPGGGTIHLEGADGLPKMYSDPRDPNVARPRQTLRGAETYVTSHTNVSGDSKIIEGDIDGRPFWTNGFMAVLGEKKPAAIKGVARTSDNATGMRALAALFDERTPLVTPVVREELYKSATGMGPTGMDSDITFLRSPDGAMIPADTKYLDYFTHRFGADVQFRHGGDASQPLGVMTADGTKVGLLMPIQKISPLHVKQATLIAAQFDEAGVSPPIGKATPAPKLAPSGVAREAGIRRNTAGGPEATAEGERRLALARESWQATDTPAHITAAGDVVPGEGVPFRKPTADEELQMRKDAQAVRDQAVAAEQARRAAAPPVAAPPAPPPGAPVRKPPTPQVRAEAVRNDPRPEVQAAQTAVAPRPMIDRAVMNTREALGLGEDAPPLPPPATPPPPVEPPRDLVPAGGAGDGGAGGAGPAAAATPGDMPARGTAGIVEALRRGNETILRPGPMGEWMLAQGPAIRRGAIFVNPSLGLQENGLHVSYFESHAVEDTITTAFKTENARTVRAIEAQLEQTPPVYIGPADWVGELNQMADIGAHPDFYMGVSPELRAAMNAHRDSGLAELRYLRGDFNVDVMPFGGQHPDFVYFPTVAATDDTLIALDKTIDELAGTGRTKRRSYERPYDRWKAAQARGKTLVFEKDIGVLMDNHAQALGRAAGRETFIAGTTGMNKMQAVDATHPGLRAAKEATARRVANLTARMETAMRQGGIAARDTRRLGGQLTNVEKRSAPILERVNELGQEYGPELSYLSGQVHELGLQWRHLRSELIARGEKVADIQTRHAGLLASYAQATTDLDRLRRQYSSADTGAYVLNDKVYRYYEAPVSAKVDGLLGRSLADQWMFKLMDTMRGIKLTLDGSLATIQGSLVSAMDPFLTAKVAGDMYKAGRDPDFMERIAVDEAEGIFDFQHDTGMQWPLKGLTASSEYSNPRGVERGLDWVGAQTGTGDLGAKLRNVNDSLWRAVTFRLYQQYKADRAMLMHDNPGMSREVAGMETSSALRGIMPLMNPAETGRGANRQIIERATVISPSFLFSPVVLASNAASGLVKLGLAKASGNVEAWQSLRGREQVALRRLAWTMGTLTSISAVSALASADANNLSYEDALAEVLNPESGRFMSLILADKASIGLGGPLRAVIRAMAPRKNQDGEYVWGAGLTSYVWDRKHPVITGLLEQHKAKDYFGADIRNGIFGRSDKPENSPFTVQLANRLFYGLESVAPIAGGELLGGLRVESSADEIAVGVAAQFAGQNLYQRRPQDEMDHLSRGRFGVDYFDASRLQQAKLKAANPGLWRRTIDSAGDQRQQYDNAKEILLTKQAVDDKAFLSGTANRDDYVSQTRDRQKELAVRGKQIYDPTGKETVAFPKPRNASERYTNEINAATQPNGTVDWETVDRWRAAQPAADQAYIIENSGVGNTATARVHSNVKRVHDVIYTLPKYSGFTAAEADQIDKLWERVRGVAGSADQQPLMAAYRQVVGAREDGVARGVRLRITGAMTTLKVREKYVEQHPDIKLFYDVGPLSPKDQARLRLLVALEQRRIETAAK